MRKINKLAALPEADRNRILTLCEHNNYSDVVHMLVKPREQGGLDLQTSASALCRFVTSCDADAADAREAGQLGEAIRSEFSGDPLGASHAILSLVQQRILAKLLTETPLRELRSDFRLMFALENRSQTPPSTRHLAIPGKNPLPSAFSHFHPQSSAINSPETPGIPHIPDFPPKTGLEKNPPNPPA